MRKRLCNQRSAKRLMLLALLFVMFMPSTAWGQIDIFHGETYLEMGEDGSFNFGADKVAKLEGNTLTLTNVQILGYIRWNSEEKLTIKVNGACSIINSGGSCIMANNDIIGDPGALSIEVGGSTNEAASLVLNGAEVAIYGFSSFSYTGFNTYNDSDNPISVTYNENYLKDKSNEDSSINYVKFQEHNILFTIGGAKVVSRMIDSKGYVTGVSSDIITGGTVQFTPADNSTTPVTPATIKLNDAKITGQILWNSLDTLQIVVNGICSIYSGSDDACIKNDLWNSTPFNSDIIFSKGKQDTYSEASLELKVSNTPAAASVFSGFNGYIPFSFILLDGENKEKIPNTAYESKIDETHEQEYPQELISKGESGDEYKLITHLCLVENFRFAINSKNVNGANKGDILGDKTVMFNPVDTTLTLNNATKIQTIIVSNEKYINFNIKLQGTNTISLNEANDNQNCIKHIDTKGSFTFTGDGSLEMTSRSSSAIVAHYIKGLHLETKTPYEIYNGFDPNDWDNTIFNNYYRFIDKVKHQINPSDTTGIKWVRISPTKTYPIWVNGTQVTEKNYDKVLGDSKISFDYDKDILTLDHATIDCNESDYGPVVSDIENLNVFLKGDNTFQVSNTIGFRFTGGEELSPTLTFTTVDRTDTENLGKLTIKGISDKTHIANCTVQGKADESTTTLDKWTSDENTSTSGWKYHESSSPAYVSYSYYVVSLDLNKFVSTNNFASYYNTEEGNFSIPEGMEAYIITGIDEENCTVKVTKLNVLPGKTPVLLYKGTATSFVSVETYTALTSGIDLSKNKLRYASAAVTTSGQEYILFNDEYVKASGTIPAEKIYLDLGMAPSSSRGFSIDVSGDATGIRTAPALVERQAEQWYDLQGRRIQKPTKAGLYIVNGKKMVVK